MDKKSNLNNHSKPKKAYTDEEKDRFIQSLAQVLSNSKYKDRDNEDM
ncbi:hypothetical protein [Ornithinibacillus halotolerans]|uniref:Uncharacterized protein n=1 Tax=Ornithinibacillus halotolerans TaxID=1274357 RepID=A0A916S0X0_9BACI|nr:hypothetical protein [Ornithinibacillus halotolerans]GGA77160.1 hypothetical protein GCM10008025_20980 [Ornithinibacillus halotolerans]